MKTTTWILGFLFSFLAISQAWGAAFPFGPSPTEKLREAIKLVEHAKTDLEEKDYDYKGHRVKVIAALDGALKELRSAQKDNEK